MVSRKSGWEASGRRTRAGAYSLIEMLLVLSVLGVVIGLVTMSMGSLRATSQSTATRQFADFINLCRSRAIAGHTAIRVGIVVKSSNLEDEFRRYSAWAWNKKTRTFEQVFGWKRLSNDLIFAPSFPEDLKLASHAARDASAVRGTYLLAASGDDFAVADAQEVRFFEFSPAGRARMASADLRNVIVVMTPGEVSSASVGANWSQFNIDTLTGRVRVYRP